VLNAVRREDRRHLTGLRHEGVYIGSLIAWVVQMFRRMTLVGPMSEATSASFRFRHDVANCETMSPAWSAAPSASVEVWPES